MKKIFLSIIGFVLVVALFIFVIVPIGTNINSKGKNIPNNLDNANSKIVTEIGDPTK